MWQEVLVLCLTVFFGRIADVTFGSVRTILLVDGKKLQAACMGFVEVFIWFTIVREALNSDIGGWYIVIAYAAGFAIGNYVGGWVAHKFVGEMLTVSIITSKRDPKIAEELREKGYGVTEIECTGKGGSLRSMLYLEIKSKKLKALQDLVNTIDKGAFLTVSKSKIAVNGFIK